jgi:surface antigen
MRVVGTGTKAYLLGSALLFSSPVLVCSAEANQSHNYSNTSSIHLQQANIRVPATYHAGSRKAVLAKSVSQHGYAGRRVVTQSGGISCVPYARQVSGIMVTGNAWQWWNNAAGEYARGDRPEPGSVLNFRANTRMSLGHVAVVTRIVNAREIIIDHANWPSSNMRGNVSRNVAVVDVSSANNWSAVRVAVGGAGEFGSVYPTYGFIYNRPDNGMITASVNRPAPQPDINPVPSDLRPAAERPWRMYEEVAESPSGQRRQIELQVSSRNGQ